MKNLNLKDAVRSRTYRVGGYSVIACAIVLVIAVLLNVVVGMIPSRFTQFDVTSNGLFSISRDSREFLKGLDEDLDVYWICQAGYEDETVGQLLESYTALNKHLKLTKLDPDERPTFAAQYTSESVSNNSILVVGEKRSRYIPASDIYVANYDNYYSTGSVDYSFDGEGQLSSAIDYCISENLPKLYVLTGHGESELSDGFASAIAKQNIETVPFSLLTLDSVPEDADAVLIYAPATDISAQELSILQDYLDSAGDILLIHGLLETGHLENVEALGARFGISMEEGLVIEGSQSHCAFGEPYYLLPDVNSHDMTNAFLSSGYSVVLPISAGLKVEDAEDDEIEVSELLKTSDSAYSKAAGLHLTTYAKEDGDIDGPFALAVCAREDLSVTKHARLVWVSSTELLADKADQLVSGGNRNFFLNILAHICEEKGSSVVVMTKSLSYDRLTMNTAQEAVWVAVIVVLLPLAFLAVGIVVRIRRKRR